MIDGGGGGAPEARGPVNAPGKKAKDPWKDIAKQAADGKLRFEPSAATKAATECVNALAGISRIQEKLLGMDPLSPLSELKSGSALATLFNGTRHGLDEVLRTHSTVLNEMLNTFKDAGKKYIEVDLDSAHDLDPELKKRMIADFDRIKPKPATDAGKFQTKMPKRGKSPETEYMDVNYEGVPVKSKEPRSASELEEQGVAFGNRDFINGGKKLTEDQIVDSSPTRATLSKFVKPAEAPATFAKSLGSNQTQMEALKLWRLESGPKSENPASQSWRDLYNLGQAVGHAVKPVLDASLAWQSMAKELDNTSKTLARYAVNKSLWEGHGVDGAVKAVENYRAKAKSLATHMNNMGKTLEYTSEWLANTKAGMPHKPDPPKPQMTIGYTADDTGNASYRIDQAAANQRNLAIHRQNMENNYVQGVQTSSLFVPALDELPTTNPKKTGHEDKPDDKQSGPGDPGTRGGGGGTGPGPGPALTGGGGGGPTPSSNYSPSSPPQIPQGGSDRTPPPTIDPTKLPQSTPTNPASADRNSIQPPSPGSDGLGQVANLAQQGIGGAESALQATANAAQKAAEGAAASGLNAARANAPAFPGGAGASSSGGGGASRIGGGAGLSGSAASALQKEADAARLFPRANAAGPAASPLGRLSGVPGAGVPAGGTPGSPGAGAGQGQGQQGKEYKRPKYLESNKHLEEALGNAPAVSKAVVEK